VTEIADRYGRIAAGFSRRLAGVGAAQWSAATPCTDWTVRDLVGHVVRTTNAVYGNLDGTTAPDVDAEDDLAGQWQRAHVAVSDALADRARAETVVRGMFGEQPFESLVSRLLCADTLVHTWDLARATAQDEVLDSEGTRRALEFLTTIDDAIRRPGGFGPKLTPAADADDQTRFLNFCGRPA
jgi:uncharacterized protein (TIGR03086 family)